MHKEEPDNRKQQTHIGRRKMFVKKSALWTSAISFFGLLIYLLEGRGSSVETIIVWTILCSSIILIGIGVLYRNLYTK